MRRSRLLFILPIFLVAALAVPTISSAQQGDDESLTIMLSGNDGLRAQGMDYVVQQIDFFNRDGSRSTARFFQQDFRWVPGDARRDAAAAGLTYLVDQSWTVEDGGLDPSTVSAVVGDAAATWNEDSCLEGAPLHRTGHGGEDVTVFDFLLGVGSFGDPFVADVVVAGLPAGMAEFFGPDTLAFSVTFVFVDGSGQATDVDGDGHLDTALNEIYFNRETPWTVTAGGDGFDLTTAALHELGHALGLGHFGSPPASVMNPVYSGVQQAPQPIDHAALCLLYAKS